jgi:hypothetical protein
VIAAHEQWSRPLLRSFAFTRLADVTFLGILSPRFYFLPRFPFKLRTTEPGNFDGSRAEHRLGVADLVWQILRALKATEDTQRYGLAWALLHDISTWPLSHTGEAAFSAVTGMSAVRLRELMILGASELPTYLTVKEQLDQMQIDADKLVLLFDKTTNMFRGELSVLWKIINSPLTPDTIEGMYRSGLVFKIRVPEPKAIVDGFISDLFAEPLIEKSKSREILRFWRAKAKIYRLFINHRRSIEFESRWVSRIERRFLGLSLAETLLLPENAIINACIDDELSSNSYAERRYKPPQDYFIASPYTRRKVLSRDYRIDDLSGVLSKERKRHI